MDKSIGFKLQNIETEQFATFEDAFTEGEQVSLSTNLKFGLDEEKQIIAVILSVQFLQKKSPFLKLDAGCHFSISESSWNEFLNKDKSKIVFPKGFITHLSVLTIGTVRGILHEKTNNTPYNNYLLPTINVTEMITEDLEIELNE